MFLHDRRQTMRLRCPLPNRAKTDENKDNFLPPLEPPASSRSTMSSMGTGRGVVGWKAPPKPVREAVVKQPTALQSESAKRLSQGLSVAHTRGQRANTNAQVTIGDVGTYSVVLDPQELNSLPPSTIPDNGAWPSTKAQRLYEESRNNRIRIEANRNSNGAVLRQQVFYFDANTMSAGDNGSMGGGIMPDFGPGIGMQQMAAAPMGNMLGLQGSSYQANPNIQNAHGSYTMKAKPAQHSIAKATALGVVNNISSSASVSSTGGGMPYQPNMNPNNAPQRNQSMGGAGGTKQEELLRQLFPSWF